MGKFLNFFSKGETCQLLVNLEGKHVRRYQFFKSLLEHNHESLALMAELEQLYYSGRPCSLAELREKVQRLTLEIEMLLADFDQLSEKKYASLSQVFLNIKNQLVQEVNPRPVFPSQDLVLPLENISPELRSMVGAKAGHLAAIKKDLDLPVPEGFAVTAVAYEKFLQENRLAGPIEEALAELNPEAPEKMEEISARIRNWILKARVPGDVAEAIFQAYDSLEQKTGKGVRLSLRSSAIGEDTEASFAGQFLTVLNVFREDLLAAYRQVLASKYTPRALFYRYQQGFDDRMTPMCVAGVRMIDSRASGVIYTRDPGQPDAHRMKISSIWGLGEHLVDGSASADQFVVDSLELKIINKVISLKDQRLVGLPGGGTHLEPIPDGYKAAPSLSDDHVLQLARFGSKLEDFFGSPQDIEWALDEKGRLFLLQSRPLNFREAKSEAIKINNDLPDHPKLLEGGLNASSGAASGKVFIPGREKGGGPIPKEAVLVAETASPNYAQWMGQINGLITDIGSVTSHLASVAREFRVPALFNTGQATRVLKDGDLITFSADTGAIYQGRVEALLDEPRLGASLFFDHPIHRRLRIVLDHIAPLNLTDPQAASFNPQGCHSYHDIIRFTHEMAVKEMFGLADAADQRALSVKLTSTIPLVLYVMDLGGGLQDGLSTCEKVLPDHFESTPMKALWKGFTHPGITWSGSINFDLGKFMTLMAVGATSEFGEMPGGDSYALLSRDYLNLSAKFGYHFATVDTLCGDSSNQNYIALQFSGGAGNFVGRSLRIYFLAEVLKKLGFDISITADLLEATLSGYDRPAMEDKLDQLGRLLACSRLLDMALSNEGDIERLTKMFFKEDYDFLSLPRKEKLEGFYIQTGDWKQSLEDGLAVCLQDGSKSGFWMSSGLAGLVGKVMGASLQEFLDNIQAYFYFPLAIAKNSTMADGTITVRVKAIRGSIDRAGGVAFGLKNAGNYFTLRLNALEDNVILFEYVNNKRFQRASVKKKIKSNRWYELKVEIRGKTIRGYIDGERILEYETLAPLKGHVGLWTKADSVTAFQHLTTEGAGQQKVFECL
jgi:pyruvate, water dikinase